MLAHRKNCRPVFGERYEYACPVFFTLIVSLAPALANDAQADARHIRFNSILHDLNHTFPGSKYPVYTAFFVSGAT